jgi:hypothetical protein
MEHITAVDAGMLAGDLKGKTPSCFRLERCPALPLRESGQRLLDVRVGMDWLCHVQSMARVTGLPLFDVFQRHLGPPPQAFGDGLGAGEVVAVGFGELGDDGVGGDADGTAGGAQGVFDDGLVLVAADDDANGRVLSLRLRAQAW